METFMCSAGSHNLIKPKALKNAFHAVKRIAFFGLFIICSPLLAAGASISIRAIGDPQTLDWNRASTWIEGFVLSNIMEGLVGIDKDLHGEPRLAEKWHSNPEHTVYTFTLRPGLKWSDGKPLRAQDFVFSWQRLLSPETKAKYAFFLFDIENAEAFHKGTLKDFSKVGIKAKDEHTLEVRLRSPIAYWYLVPSFYATFPMRNDLIGKNTVGLGPYVLAQYEPGKVLVLKHNPYFREPEALKNTAEQLIFRIVPDDATAIRLYEQGELDLLAKIPSLERRRVAGREDFKTWPDLRVIHLRMNTVDGPTQNIHFRRALAYAIDRKKLEQIFESGYKPATSFVPPGMIAYTKKGGVVFNPAKAKQELKASGLDPTHMPPLDLLTIGFTDQILLAQFIQEELKRNLGVPVRIHSLEPKRYYDPHIRHTKYSMQINFWGADFPDSDNFFSIFLSSSGLNRYGWSNKHYDELVTGARSLPSKKEREAQYLEAQHILLEDEVATIPMYYGRIHGLVRNTVTGFNSGSMNWWQFKSLRKQTSVEEKQK